jgi:translocation and assembly module TamB
MSTKQSSKRPLRRAARILLIGGRAAVGVAALLFAIALYTLRTDWFKQQVRQKIVAAAEQATGGRVELGAFRYDWRTLDAEFDGFVVHGSEAANSQPLFRAPVVRVGLRIVSLLRRDVDVRFLMVERPRISVVIAPNGSTNFPRELAREGSAELVNELFRLRVDRFDIHDGLIEVDAQRFPLTIRGDDLKMLVAREQKAAQYQVSIAARRFESDWERLRGLSGDVNAKLLVDPKRVVVQNFAFAAPEGEFQARGAVRQLANPIADFNVHVRMNARFAAAVLHNLALQDGDVGLSGAVHYSANAGASFDGTISGRKLAYRVDGRTLHNIDFDSAVAARDGAAHLKHVDVRGGGGRAEGEGVLRSDGVFEFAGRFSGFNMRDAGAIAGREVPWSGIVNGTARISGTLGRRNLVATGVMHIAPQVAGIPVSGDLDVSYRQLGERLSFGESRLNLPHTHMSFSGTWGESLQLSLDSTDLSDFSTKKLADLAVGNGNIHFDGTVSGSLLKTYVHGNVTATGLRFGNLVWQEVRARAAAAEGGIDLSALTADSGSLHLAGSGHVGLQNWRLQPASTVRLQAKFQGADLAAISSGFAPAKLQLLGGVGSGSVELSGSISDPRGSVDLHIDNLDAYGQQLNTVQINASIEGDRVRIAQGRMRSGIAALSFSGEYRRDKDSWDAGVLSLNADSNGFPLSSLAAVRNFDAGLQGLIEIHGQATARISAQRLEPMKADGRVTAREITINGIPYGSIALGLATRGDLMEARFSGDLRETKVSGAAQVRLAEGLPSSGEAHIDRLGFGALYAMTMPNRKTNLPFDGFIQGGVTFSGPLEDPQAMRGSVRLEQAELRPSMPEANEDIGRAATELVFRNNGPIEIDAANGLAKIRTLEIQGKDTALSVRGTVPYLPHRSIDLIVGGSADLRLLRLFDPNMKSSGQSSLAASVTGAFENPAISGTLRLKNGSFFLKDVPNGLTEVNGRVDFDRDRATLRDLKGQTGGGALSLTGFVTYGGPGPLVYSVGGGAENVRMRYAGGSITSDAKLQLTGTSKSSVLSGTVAVSRVALNANTDVGTLVSSLAAPAPANEQDFLTGLQLDVHVENAPNMQLSTALSRDVEAEIDLRLRGTVNHPVVLGSVSANQGDIKVFGAKYSINRAQVSFTNPVKIEPVLDLDLQTRARGVLVDITIAGTPGKLNINYRSDPPLQPRDIIALLTVGRAPDAAENVPSTTANDVSALQSGVNTVLGAAVSPSSSRLQKLFGVANVKIDPMVQGITNTMQRLTIEQQISRDITVTYVTNLSQTSEQIFRLEWALSPQYSLVALRDDNGEFGIDIQYKKRFK